MLSERSFGFEIFLGSYRTTIDNMLTMFKRQKTNHKKQIISNLQNSKYETSKLAGLEFSLLVIEIYL